MITAVRYVLSLPLKRQIVDIGKVVRNARHIAVIFPVEEKNMPNYRNSVATLVREKFTGCKIFAIVGEGSNAIGFDDIIYFVPGFATLARKFFETKAILRNLHIDISFDLNETVDVISYLVGAPLRIGAIESPFFNLVVKGIEGEPARMFSIIGTTPLNTNESRQIL
ncbi:MAG: hypothetical protein U9R01_06925 [candidate division WOR-3 bacterium]|nr:hypothetical protein [candidate division WOR-3 bacterium]